MVFIGFTKMIVRNHPIAPVPPEKLLLHVSTQHTNLKRKEITITKVSHP